MTDIVEEARAMLAKPTTPITDLRNGIRDLADECERLSAALDAMTNQAVMASGRRATIVTEDGELERLRAENARLREAMIDVAYWERCRAHEDTVEGTYSPYTRDEYAREFHDDLLARLDAAKEGR